MDVAKMINELRAERDAIDEAIVTLERVAHGHVKRRGRPPAWLAEIRNRHTDGGERPAQSKRVRKHASETA